MTVEAGKVISNIVRVAPESEIEKEAENAEVPEPDDESGDGETEEIIVKENAHLQNTDEE